MKQELPGIPRQFLVICPFACRSRACFTGKGRSYGENQIHFRYFYYFPIFLFFFLPAALFCYYIVPQKFIRVRNAVLLLFSLIFYAWGEPVYVVLMIFSIIFNYLMGLDIEERRKIGKQSAKRSLIFTIAVDIGLLGFFKYYGFFTENLNQILPFDLPSVDVTLPVGISFYTFQTLSYIIDVYRGNVDVQVNLIDFGTYVTMFPQLIAGPIVQYADVERQLRERKESLTKFGYGAWFFVIGLAKKVLLANTIGSIYENIAAMDGMSVVTAWLGCLAYTFQIYFDFSGYSDMAVGLGKMFGFEFMQNFNYPYISKSVTEFWRRWHISLGSWFREYVYIPLGGNRVTVPRHLLNLLIVWFLTGLWHGASWNFVVWGLFYGVILITEKYFTGKILAKLPEAVQTLYTMILVMLGWVLFFSPTLGSALTWIGNMFGQGATGFMDSQALYLIMRNWLFWVAGIIGSTPFMHLLGKRLVFNEERPHTVLAGCLMTGLFVLCVAYLVTESYNPFLYFRF